MTWRDVEDGERGVFVVPLGSTEQHGPHLPLSTDTLIAESVATALCSRLPAAVLAPSIAIGASGEHAGFPGTVSIGTNALSTLLVELVRDASRDWHRVVVVNGHGGNADALRRTATICAHERRPIDVVECGVPGMDGHAGRSETSLMLHLHPGLVRIELAEPGVSVPVADLAPRLRDAGVRTVSPNGVLGDPRGASAAEGARLFAAILDRIDR